MATRRVQVEELRPSSDKRPETLRPVASPVDNYVRPEPADRGGMVRAEALAKVFGTAERAMANIVSKEDEEKRRQEAAQKVIEGQNLFYEYQKSLPLDMDSLDQAGVENILNTKKQEFLTSRPIADKDVGFFFEKQFNGLRENQMLAARSRAEKALEEQKIESLGTRIRQISQSYEDTERQASEKSSKAVTGAIVNGQPGPLPNTPIVNKIVEAAKKAGLRPEEAMVVATLENSKFDPNARPIGKDGKPLSTAHGLFQLLDAEWNAQGGGDRNNEDKQIENGIKSLAARKADLEKRLGRKATTVELYLAHQQGAAGAAKILTADPNTPIESLIGAKAAANNAMAGKTAGEAIAMWTGKVERTGYLRGGIEVAAANRDTVASADAETASARGVLQQELQGLMDHAVSIGVPRSKFIEMLWKEQLGISMLPDKSQRHFGILKFLEDSGNATSGRYADHYKAIVENRDKWTTQEKSVFQFDLARTLDDAIRTAPEKVTDTALRALINERAGIDDNWVNAFAAKRDAALSKREEAALKQKLAEDDAKAFGPTGSGMLAMGSYKGRTSFGQEFSVSEADRIKAAQQVYLQTQGQPREGEIENNDDTKYIQRLTREMFRYTKNEQFEEVFKAGRASLTDAATDEVAMQRFGKAVRLYSQMFSADPHSVTHYPKEVQDLYNTAIGLQMDGYSAKQIAAKLSDTSVKTLTANEQQEFEAGINSMVNPFIGSSAMNANEVRTIIKADAMVNMKKGISSEVAIKNALERFKTRYVKVDNSFVSITSPGLKAFTDGSQMPTPERAKAVYENAMAYFKGINSIKTDMVILAKPNGDRVQIVDPITFEGKVFTYAQLKEMSDTHERNKRKAAIKAATTYSDPMTGFSFGTE